MRVIDMSWDELLERFDRAKSAFLLRDATLLVRAAGEPLLTGRFAFFLQNEFPEWDVDPEFNLDGDRRKLTNPYDRLVRPDIIVHQRHTHRNLIVFEAKKSRVSDNADRVKLKAFKTDPRYLYAYAALLRFVTGDQPDIHIIRV